MAMGDLQWGDEAFLVEVSKKIKPKLKKVAEEIQQEAKQILKTKIPESTGSLADSIDVREIKTKTGSSEIGYLIEAYGKLSAKEGNKYYASFVELGAWVYPYGNKSASGGKVYLKPTPFLRPAFKNKRSKLLTYTKGILK